MAIQPVPIIPASDAASSALNMVSIAGSTERINSEATSMRSRS